jgi:DNA polymerase-3 subunit gamma/tau
MVLIRIAHSAELPSPDDLIRLLGTGAGQARGGSPAPRAQQDGARLQAAPAATPMAKGNDTAQRLAVAASAAVPVASGPRSFAEVVALAGEHRDARLKVHLEEHVRLVRFEPGRLEIHLLDGSPSGLANELNEKLAKWTGRRWGVVVSRELGEPPLGEVRRQREAAELAEIKNDPAVRALLDVFPEAEVKAVRPLPGAPEDECKTG